MHDNVKIGPARLRGIVPRLPVVAEAADILKLRADAQQGREAAQRIIDSRPNWRRAVVRQGTFSECRLNATGLSSIEK